MSALVVEDDVRLATFTSDYLATHAVSVTHVTDGEAAMAAASQQRFDVIVLDIMIPVKNGLSVCKAITTYRFRDSQGNAATARP